MQFYFDPFKFPDKCFGFRSVLVDEFTEIVPIVFEPFLDHHMGLFASVKISVNSYMNSNLKPKPKHLLGNLKRS